jgi:hypothetical protein
MLGISEQLSVKGWEDTRPLARGGAIHCYGLQLLCKPVHSLNYTVVAANKVRHDGIGKPRL